MLTVCIVIFFGISGPRAQTYIPVPYNFGGIFEVDDGVSPTPVDFSIDCMAANNYGIWTSSYKNTSTSAPQGMLLLGNAIRGGVNDANTSTGIVDARPVAAGTSYPVVAGTTNITDVKVVCNLLGQVRYVWPSVDHKSFIVEGFDECTANSLNGVNLEFQDYPYNESYGSSDAQRLLAEEVIKPSELTQYYPVYAEDVGDVFHPVVYSGSGPGSEPDPRDWFDIAMDESFLYIIWEEYDATSNVYNIWERSENLSTGALSDAIQLTPSGRRPTIAVDVRWSCAYPTFDVAYITDPTSPTGQIIFQSDLGDPSYPPLEMGMDPVCEDPQDAGLFPYTKIFHVRILDASTEGFGDKRSAIYAVVQTGDGLAAPNPSTHLIMHKVKGYLPDPQAYYCDGPLLSDHAPGVDDGFFDVVDNPIRAFANPYDGESDNEYDEYHCLYQIARDYLPPGSSTFLTHYPLMIVHGAIVYGSTTMTGPKQCLSYYIPGQYQQPDSDPITTARNGGSESPANYMFYPDPAANTDGGFTDNYNGAVNQMGVHVHWRCGNQHYYIRDRRTFDEDIEENTLVTEDVYVGNGSSHWGTTSPTLQDGKTMAIWYPASGSWNPPFPDPVNINFPFSDVDPTNLIIGKGDGGAASKLVVLRRFTFNAWNQNQLIDVKPSSSIEWYNDKSFWGNWQNGGINLEGSGATMLTGVNGGTYPSNPISNPAMIHLHAGMSMYLGPNTTIEANDGLIESYAPRDITVPGFFIDADVIEIIDGVPTLVPDGTISEFSYGESIKPQGQVAVTNSIALADYSLGCPFEFDGAPNYATSSQTVNFTNCLFNTIGSGGFLWLNFGYGQTAPDLPLTISGGKFDGVGIYSSSWSEATQSTTIEGTIFDNVPATGIESAITFFNGFPSISDYATQLVYNCDFRTFSQPGMNGILVDQFAYGPMTNITIANNTFTTNNSNTENAAIYLYQGTNAWVSQNIITAQGFSYGIIQEGLTPGFTSYPTTSMLCSNTIKNMSITGISTGDWIGFGVLNSISHCAIGHTFSGHNFPIPNLLSPGILFSNYSNNNGPGIETSDPWDVPDLTGGHSDDGSQDYAAFDTIENNATAQISIYPGIPGAQPTQGIYLGLARPHPGTWTDWSRNNILNYSEVGSNMLILVNDGYGDLLDDLGDISQNYWGTVGSALINPIFDQQSGCIATSELSAPSTWLHTPDAVTRAEYFCFTVPTTEPICTMPQGIQRAQCVYGLPQLSHKKSEKPAAMLADTSCYDKYALAFQYEDDAAGGDISGHDWTLAYNAAQNYLESCYDSFTVNYDAFGIMSDAIGGMGTAPHYEDTDNGRWANYRDWLKSVLWLNRINPVWYCLCADAIVSTYQWDSTNNGIDYNAGIAVIRFLLQSGRCTFYSSDENSADSQAVAQRHSYWLDTVDRLHNGDTTDFPEDTIIPTIQELGLQVLLGPPADVNPPTPSQTGIGLLTASENPFTTGTTISFTMGEYAYVSFQLSDILGHVVQGDFKGTVLSPGEHSFNIDGTNLPSGTYFARVTTPIGETRTLKVVKE